MSSDLNQEFETAGAGASLTFPMQAGALRKGGHVMLKGHPCKIVEISVSKTGKHGHAKCHIVGIDIFTNKKCEDLCPSSHNMDVPNVKKDEYTLMDIDEDAGSVSCLMANGDCKDDLNLPPDAEISNPMKAAFAEGKSLIVTVQSSMDQEQIIAWKEAAN